MNSSSFYTKGTAIEQYNWHGGTKNTTANFSGYGSHIQCPLATNNYWDCINNVIYYYGVDFPANKIGKTTGLTGDICPGNSSRIAQKDYYANYNYVEPYGVLKRGKDCFFSYSLIPDNSQTSITATNHAYTYNLNTSSVKNEKGSSYAVIVCYS